MKRLPRTAGLLVAAALVSTTPALAVAALTAAPAVSAATVATAQVTPASNISWD